VDVRRLRVQEWIAGAAGAVLVVSLFLEWYGAGAKTWTAWQSFGTLDVVLAVAGLMAIALAVVAVVHRTQAVPLAIGSLLVLLGVVASAWLVFRVASPPDGVTHREAGLWIALVACLAVTIAALASIRDERFPRAVVDAAQAEPTTLPAPARDGARERGS
jgi:hypothetical protein